MNETPIEISSYNEAIQWLQRKYIQVPGTVSISSADVYRNYFKEHSSNVLPKRSIGQLVPKIFNQVKVVNQYGPTIYRGLRQNFYDPESYSAAKLHESASKYGFVPMTEVAGCISFICYSDYIVNNQRQIKTVRITSDNTVSVSIGEKQVSLSDIGLDKIKLITTEDANIVFNTVKQAQICCGKLADPKTKVSRNSLFQQWMRNGDENSIENRLSASKCKKVVPLTAYSSTCTSCKAQTVISTHSGKPQSSKDIPEDKLSLLKSLFPGCSDLMLKILTAQSNICNLPGKNPRCRRWDKEIIQVCLTLWNRSPQAYSSLCSSGMLFLPSINLLQRYKNCFDQTPGLNNNMLIWMFNEAKRLNIDMRGGLILDEMAIQDDLKMSFYSGKNTVDGLVEMGSFAEDLYSLNSHKNELRLATHVLQFLFLSYDGFRFPFAYYPSTGANVPELYMTIWEAISKLSTYGFTTDYVCFDGASNNRAFQLMHFLNKDEAKSQNFTAKNPFGENKLTLIMDYSHNTKKLRNNINSSGDHEMCTRKLTLDTNFIVWAHWIEAFNWDRSQNPMRVHQKLTNDHIFLTNTSKMRNHLAEEVLNSDMLHLMKMYQGSLSDGSYLKKSIELLEHTSPIIELFRDRRPLADLNDPRLECLGNFEKWLESWYQSVENLPNTLATAKAKMFISKETYSDLISMIRGFLSLCTLRIKDHERSLVPAGLNSDVIENFFCQQRTICHGSNTNPTVHQYKYGINATILGQNAVSKKSNASSSKRKSIQPFSISKPGPLKRKCIRM